MQQPGPLGYWLATVEADGTGLAVIATGAWQSPRISPDGAQIAAVELVDGGGPRLVLMDRNGGDRQVILLPNGSTNQVDWSPDGSKLVVTNTSFNLLAIYDRASGAKQVIHPGAGVQYSPSWSPDGSLIAFRDSVDLWVIPASGGTKRSLTEALSANVREFTWDGASALLFRAGTTVYRVDLNGGAPEPVASNLTTPAS
jgi:Tol biopolymer transport system component